MNFHQKQDYHLRAWRNKFRKFSALSQSVVSLPRWSGRNMYVASHLAHSNYHCTIKKRIQKGTKPLYVREIVDSILA